MNILEFEKYLMDKNFKEEDFLEDLERNFKEELNLSYPNKERKLTEEEIIADYFDPSIIELFESLEEDNNENICECSSCNCSKEDDVVEKTTEKRLSENRKLVYRLGLYLLRDGIHYDDLTQEGLLGLLKANYLYSEEDKFNLYKSYFIIKEMFEHIKKYVEYRELSFREYIKNEKDKPKKVKISLRNSDDEKKEELRKLELENELKHKADIKRLEDIVKKTFGYFNLKYRLSLREIELISLYFALKDTRSKSNSEIESILGLSSDDLEKLLKESFFKLSVTNEKVEL